MTQRSFPILATADLPRALGFYRDLLGYKVTYQFPAEGDPVYAGLELNGSDLGIGQESGMPDPSGEPRLPEAGHPFALCFYAEDCDSLVAALREKGVRIVAEPADQPWGERMAKVTDPDGNLVVIMHEVIADEP